jgi:hypothetical protein
MTAEEIYPLIDDNDQSETLDTHAYDPTDQQTRASGMTEKRPPGAAAPRKALRRRRDPGPAKQTRSRTAAAQDQPTTAGAADGNGAQAPRPAMPASR